MAPERAAEPLAGCSVEEVLALASGQAIVTLAGPADAPPLLVLHDAGGDTVDAPAWTDLARDHRVAQLRLPGHGGSTPPPAGVGLAWVTDHLAAVLDGLGWASAHVVGTSLGGWFAAELALAHPGRTARLTLCDPAGLQSPQGYLLALFADGRASAGTDALVEQRVLSHLSTDQRDVAANPTAVTRAAVAPYVAEMAAAALSSWNPWVPDPGMLARLPALRVPTTIVWGERDALIPLAHGRAMASAIPGARLVVVPRAGHLLPLEHADRVAAAVRDPTGPRRC